MHSSRQPTPSSNHFDFAAHEAARLTRAAAIGTDEERQEIAERFRDGLSDAYYLAETMAEEQRVDPSDIDHPLRQIESRLCMLDYVFTLLLSGDFAFTAEDLSKLCDEFNFPSRRSAAA
jgi:hypothetical protein